MTKQHAEKYEALCQKYGIKWTTESPRLVGETIESMIEKYKQDEHLNNIPLKYWDALAMTMLNRQPLYEKVCMSKYAAKKMLEEYMKKGGTQ